MKVAAQELGKHFPYLLLRLASTSLFKLYASPQCETSNKSLKESIHGNISISKT
jgi:hypothetical protein